MRRPSVRELAALTARNLAFLATFAAALAAAFSALWWCAALAAAAIGFAALSTWIRRTTPDAPAEPGDRP